MRVLVLSHTYIANLNCEKLRTLAHLDPSLEVAVGVPRRWSVGNTQHRLIESQAWDDGNFRLIPLGNFSQNNQGLLGFGPDLVTLLREFQPQVIQVEEGAKSLAYAQTITLNRLLDLKAKNVLFVGWPSSQDDFQFPVSWLESYNLRHTHGLVAGRPRGAEALRQRGYQGPSCIMPQVGVDETCFFPQAQPDLARQIRIAEGTFVVGFVGQFVAEKGVLTLCQALASLREHPQPWVWLLLGRGDLKDTLPHHLQAAGIADRVRWVESVPHREVPRYLNLMDALVLPTDPTHDGPSRTATDWPEPSIHLLLSAMACAVPIVGSDGGTAPHVVEEAGLSFPAANATALAARLRLLLDNPGQRQTLAERAYGQAMAHYTNTALAKHLLDFYRTLGVEG